MIRSIIKALLAAAALTAAHSAVAAPRVVVSIKPIHALVAGVMAGVGDPDVLVKGAASPHEYALKPSDAQALAQAELVFWVGPALETFLQKPLTVLDQHAHVVTLQSARGVHVLADSDEPTSIDGHIWLDIDNAKAIVGVVAESLSAADAANAPRYGANAAALIDQLDRLDAELRAQLIPVSAKPFLVFHDAYRYFQQRYNLHGVGAVTVNPERMAGARHIAELRKAAIAAGNMCVFAEPQFAPRLMVTLTEGTGARTGVLDPEGSTLSAAPGLYFELMRKLGDNLVRCLSAP